MKSNIYSILAAGAMVMAVASCDDWTPPTAQMVDVNLSGLKITSDDAQKMVASNAAASKAVSPEFKDYIVTITSLDTPTAPMTWSYEKCPEVVTLAAGNYRIDVESHAIKKAEWENPYYKGSQEFNVAAGRITRIGEIEAKFSSIRVSVLFSDDLLAVIGDDAKVTIIVNDESTLDFTPGETRSAYFEHQEGSFSMISHFEGTINGAYTISDKVFTDVAAGQHHKVTYSVKGTPVIPEPTGAIDPTGGISLDVDVTEVPIDENVTTSEEVIDKNPNRPSEEPETPDQPGPDEPVETPAATFSASATSTNLNLNGMNEAAAGFGDCVVEMACPEGMAHLKVTITSDSEDFLGLLVPMDMAETFDLAYPSQTIINNCEELLHFPYGDQVIGKTNVNFDITSFIPMLAIIPGYHTFVIEVVDANGNSASQTLRFHVSE